MINLKKTERGEKFFIYWKNLKLGEYKGIGSSPDNDKASSGTSVWKETDFQAPKKGDSSE